MRSRDGHVTSRLIRVDDNRDCFLCELLCRDWRNILRENWVNVIDEYWKKSLLAFRRVENTNVLTNSIDTVANFS